MAQGGGKTGEFWVKFLVCWYPDIHTAGSQPNWMAPPQQTVSGCPPGLEYLTQIDQLLVNQQVELFEGRCEYGPVCWFEVLPKITKAANKMYKASNRRIPVEESLLYTWIAELKFLNCSINCYRPTKSKKLKRSIFLHKAIAWPHYKRFPNRGTKEWNVHT